MSDYETALQGKRVLVTGGSSGIGKAIAAKLKSLGAVVAINGRDQAALDAACAELGTRGIQGDVAQESDAQRIVETFTKEEGGIDILINNAGFGRFGTLLETTPEDMESIWRTNVLGAFMVGQAAARHMVEQRSGTIVNIASTAGVKGFARGSAYASSKFALRGMTECWRDELRRHDVRVVLCNPSEVVTDFSRRAGGSQEPNPKKLIPEDIADAVAGALVTDPRGFVPEFSVFATNPF
ncbi:MAG: 3-oxoacyl-[acyl-carrier protein] reductase [Planctomycetota bacterium]|jgi:3-oxoacyl-[acyl-carrier protein] reductase